MSMTEDMQCGDGSCKSTIALSCQNFGTDDCYTCMFNTAGTTRDHYDGDLDSSEFEIES